MDSLQNCTSDASSINTSFVEVSNSSSLENARMAEPLPVPMTWENYLAPAIFTIICLVGVAGNSLVIYVVAFVRKMRTVTNFYFCNLAVTDLAFLLCCVPFTAVQYATPSWIFGENMCKLVNYMMQVTVQATCLTLAALSVDRYCAIVHPVASLIFRRKAVAIASSVLIWIVSFLMAIPVPMYYRLMEWNWRPYGWHTLCRPVWPSTHYEKGYMIYTVLSTYFIPLGVCVVCCVPIVYRLWHRFDHNSAVIPRNNAGKTRKSTFMVIGVVVLFTLCWLPNHAINLWWYSSSSKKLTAAVYYSKFAGICLSYANSATNPFVYAIVGDSFRDTIKQAFTKKEKQRVGRKPTPYRPACRTNTYSVESRMKGSGASGCSTKVQLYVTSSNEIESQVGWVEAESSV